MEQIELNLLLSDYITITDSDDDTIYNLKHKLRKLDLPDLRLFVIWIEYDQNYTLCSQYFNTTVYFIKKRINKIKESLCIPSYPCCV